MRKRQLVAGAIAVLLHLSVAIIPVHQALAHSQTLTVRMVLPAPAPHRVEQPAPKPPVSAPAPKRVEPPHRPAAPAPRPIRPTPAPKPAATRAPRPAPKPRPVARRPEQVLPARTTDLRPGRAVRADAAAVSEPESTASDPGPAAVSAAVPTTAASGGKPGRDTLRAVEASRGGSPGMPSGPGTDGATHAPERHARPAVGGPAAAPTPEPSAPPPAPPAPKPEQPKPAPKPEPAPVTVPVATPEPPKPPAPAPAARPDPAPKPDDGLPGRPQPLSRPAPSFPRSVRETLQGPVSVSVSITVSAGGSVTGVSVTGSSGHSAIDQAAASGCRRWRFSRARNGATFHQTFRIKPL